MLLKQVRQPAQNSLPGRARDQAVEKRQGHPADDHQNHELAFHCPVSFLFLLPPYLFPITVLKIHYRRRLRCDHGQIEPENRVSENLKKGLACWFFWFRFRILCDGGGVPPMSSHRCRRRD